MKVRPVLAQVCERVRYGGVEAGSVFDPSMPQDVPLGQFEYQLQGTWYKAHGSYLCDGEPMVWLEMEGADE